MSGIEDRFNTRNYKDISSLAILLDPRFKKEEFLGNSIEYEEAYACLHEKLIPFKTQCENDTSTVEECTEIIHDDDIWGVFKQHVQP